MLTQSGTHAPKRKPAVLSIYRTMQLALSSIGTENHLLLPCKVNLAGSLQAQGKTKGQGNTRRKRKAKQKGKLLFHTVYVCIYVQMNLNLFPPPPPPPGTAWQPLHEKHLQLEQSHAALELVLYHDTYINRHLSCLKFLCSTGGVICVSQHQTAARSTSESLLPALDIILPPPVSPVSPRSSPLQPPVSPTLQRTLLLQNRYSHHPRAHLHHHHLGQHGNLYMRSIYN